MKEMRILACELQEIDQDLKNLQKAKREKTQQLIIALVEAQAYEFLTIKMDRLQQLTY